MNFTDADLQAAIDNFKKENPHLKEDAYFQAPEKSMTIRAYLAGIAHRDANPRPAPQREEWEKLKQAEVEQCRETYGELRLVPAAHFEAGFDACLRLIAEPLLGEVDKWKKAAVSQVGFQRESEKEIDRLKAALERINKWAHSLFAGDPVTGGPMTREMIAEITDEALAAGEKKGEG